MFGTLIIENRRNEGLTPALCFATVLIGRPLCFRRCPSCLSRISDTPEKQYRTALSLADSEEEWMVSAKDGNWRRPVVWRSHYTCHYHGGCRCGFSTFLIDLDECLMKYSLDE